MSSRNLMSDTATLAVRWTASPPARRCGRRSGFTTIELLITVAIIATVTALALPTVKETLRHNALTRATNAVSGAFLNARTLAARDGKPYGVRLERFRQDITPGQSGGRVGLSDANLNNANVCQRIVYVGAAGETGRLTIGDPSLAAGTAGADVGAYLLQTLNPSAATTGDRSWLLFIPRSASEYLYAAIDQNNASFVSDLIGVGSRVTLFIRGEYPGNKRAVLRGQIADRVMNVAAEPTLVNVAGRPTLTSLITAAAAAPAPTSDVNDFAITTPGVIDTALGGTTAFSEPGVAMRVTWSASGDRVYRQEYLLPDRGISMDDRVANLDNPPTYNTGVVHALEFEMNPIEAPLQPLTLPGRAVVDLSYSGSRRNPTLFNVLQLMDGGNYGTDVRVADNVNASGGVAVPDNGVEGITIMFSPASISGGESLGRVDSVRIDSFNPADGTFSVRTITPPAVMSFLVGYSTGVSPDHVDDLARFGVRWSDYTAVVPDFGASTDFPSYTGQTPPSNSAWEPRNPPNVTNPECGWVTIMSATGNVRVDGVSPPEEPDVFVARVNALNNANPPARRLTHLRIDHAKRLIFGGNR